MCTAGPCVLSRTERVTNLPADNFFREVSEFIVSVIQARDLEASEVTGSLDSYVKVTLTPHRDGKVQTKVGVAIVCRASDCRVCIIIIIFIIYKAQYPNMLKALYNKIKSYLLCV